MNATWIDTIRLSLTQRQAARQWAQHTRAGIRYVELSSARIRVRIAGQGLTTLVFVADPPNVIEHYDALFDLLTPVARVLCFEAPGFGFSVPKRGYDFTLEQQTKAIVELLEAVQMGPYTLAFSCVAVYVALKVAEEYPHLVEKLVLMQAPSWAEEMLWGRRIDPNGWMRTPVIGQLAFPAQKRAVSQGWYNVAVGKIVPPSHFLPPCLQAFDHGAWYCLPSLMQGMFARKEASFGKVEQPTIILWGGVDRTHRRTDTRSVLRYVHKAPFITFERAGHFPELEEPERFVQLLQEHGILHGQTTS